MLMTRTYEILTEEEADGILEQIIPLEWKVGKARTKELTGTVKRNLELGGKDYPIVKSLCDMIATRLVDNTELRLDWCLKQAQEPKFNNYVSSGTYGRHVDAAVMGKVRTDMACTVFLTDPDTYEGGVLTIEGPDGPIEHKGKKGEAFVYTCGYPHYVTPVTSGQRICAITWFESLVRDPKKRELLKNLVALCRTFESKVNDDNDEFRPWVVDVGKIHTDLCRMWLD